MVKVNLDNNIILARALLNMMRHTFPQFDPMSPQVARSLAKHAMLKFNAVPTFSFDQDYIIFERESDMTMFLLKWG